MPLLTIYKSFIRPPLNYGDIIYDQAYNVSFHQKLDSIQYNAALAITGAIRGTFKEKLYDQLGLETLEKKRRCRKLCCFFKIFRYKCPKYLFKIIPTFVSRCNTRNSNNIPLFKVKHNSFQNSFFPSAAVEWNKLDLNIRNSKRLKKTLLNFIRPSGSTVFNCRNPKGVKLLTRLRLGLSHLREHKFKHSFQDSLNPICSCGNDTEASAHFLLHCPNFSKEISTFLNIKGSIERNISPSSDSQVTETLWYYYGDSNSNNITNSLILNATIDFVIAAKSFDVSLL